MNLTKHASDRLQQRGIPRIAVDLLHEYGARRYDHHGVVIRYFDKRSRERLVRERGKAVVARLAGVLNVYMVVSAADDAVLTVAHRYPGRRIARN